MKKRGVPEILDIATVGQILTAIKDSIAEIKKAKKEKDAEDLVVAKREILGFQRKLDELL
ncbi:MAG: hypothetical protein ABIG28_03305 [archaeon]